jgi:hypothetical protein
MNTMKSRVLAALALVLLSLAPVLAQADIGGEWDTEFWTPRGPLEMTMYISQEGAALKGYLTNENGEFPLRGRIECSDFNVTWQFPDRGTLLNVVFPGKINVDTMNGSVKLGTLGSGRLYATRTGR